MRFLKYVGIAVALLGVAGAVRFLARGDAAEVADDARREFARQGVAGSHDLILPIYEPEFAPYAQSNLDPTGVEIALSVDGDCRSRLTSAR